MNGQIGKGTLEMKKMFGILAVILLGAVLVFSAATETRTEAEAYREPFAEFKENTVPLNLSCEDQGVKVTVVSARLTDTELKIQYELQDLEDGRLDYGFISRDREDLFSYNLDINEKSHNGVSTGTSNSHEKPDCISIFQTVVFNRIHSEDTLTISMADIPATVKKSFPVQSLLDAYGNTSEGVELPEHAGYSRPTNWQKEMKVLDYSRPLDIPLNDEADGKKVLLTGIGWIDNQLHIQIHDADGCMQLGSYINSFSFPVQCNYKNRSFFDSYPQTALIAWDEDSDYNLDWVEYVIECKPEEVAEMEYTLDLTYVKEMLDGEWEFSIPLEQIRDPESIGVVSYSNLFGFSDKLKPIHYSCEDQGIRVTALAALAKENNLYIVYSLEDLEGDRIQKYNRDWYAQDDWFNYNINKREYSWVLDGVFSYGDVKDQYLVMQRLGFDRLNNGKTLTASLDGIPAEGDTTIPLLPVLKQYGITAENGKEQPDTRLSVRTQGFKMDKTKVLDIDHPLNVPFSDKPGLEKLTLNGIGWIDGQMHFQMRYPKNMKVDLYGKVTAEGMLQWDDTGDSEMTIAEYVIDCLPEDLERLECELMVTYTYDVVKGSWELNIPLDEIRETESQP